MADTFTDYDPATLPTPVVAFLDAHDADRHADALAAFAPDATVLDDGGTHEGTEAIRAWLERSSTAYTYTSTRVGQRVTDPTHPVVRIRLDGSFPGGTVTLRYQFTLHAGRISRLAIEV
ncbi:nuclear transport factor 2 family protein [Streptomyces sp. 3MP-14]|uniref:Nuclear transport factor 2 family protein n=1 Tax=Streptomyces mimosae TaxID=2586635 RepID=A0A5N6ANL8_9ACTN|nr:MULTISPECIES: nuclear transport factor 2 family protein [Streptomyces]KAB8169712.1 nuclear transport factor 2 family protein [Streptomyces mimosae]KAB8178460.1 nuclear transport factor 2 family protein [Streptomyces sp. 3MP-14]